MKLVYQNNIVLSNSNGIEINAVLFVIIRLSPDIDWPEDEDGLEIRKSLRVTPPKKQRSSTVPLQKSVDMAVESMEMRRLSGNGMDETDGKEPGVKMM